MADQVQQIEGGETRLSIEHRATVAVRADDLTIEDGAVTAVALGDARAEGSRMTRGRTGMTPDSSGTCGHPGISGLPHERTVWIARRDVIVEGFTQKLQIDWRARFRRCPDRAHFRDRWRHRPLMPRRRHRLQRQ
jgi:hypothetical protein